MPSSRSAEIASTLSAGSSSGFTAEIPTSFATRSAMARLSPVSIVVSAMPSDARSRMASALSGFSSSAKTAQPRYTPFAAA